MENRLSTLLSELVRINSINRTLSDGPGEQEIAKFVARHLKSLNLDAEIQEVGSSQSNVVARIEGQQQNRSLLLNAHLDTVGVDGMDQPFKLRRKGDRLYGRGTYDMKGSVALMLLLVDHFTRHPPPLDVFLTFVADEEDKSRGMEFLVENWLPQVSPPLVGALFLEPTEEDIGVCHKGFTWYEVAVTGKAAHGSRPEQGIDAILPLQSVMAELSKIQAELLRREPDPLLGHASLHASKIKGGSELSVIPGRACIQWERRTRPGESARDLNIELERVVQAVADHPGKHSVSGRELFVRRPHRVPDDAKILEHLQNAAPQSKQVGLSFWADSALAGAAGVPAILYGPVGHGAHAVDEWVSLGSLKRVYDVLRILIESF